MDLKPRRNNIPRTLVIPTRALTSIAFFLQAAIYIGALFSTSSIVASTPVAPNASGQRQKVYSLFDTVGAYGYPAHSLYLISVALAAGVKAVIAALFCATLWRLCGSSSYKNVSTAVTCTIVGSIFKFVTWLIACMVSTADDQGSQSRCFFVFLVASNMVFGLTVFVILEENIALFDMLAKASNFNRGSLSYRKVFNLQNHVVGKYWAWVRHISYVKFLKANYASYTCLQLILWWCYYNHQIANDISLLNYFNCVSWIVLFYDLLIESAVVDVLGLGSCLDKNEGMHVTVTSTK